MKWYAYAALVFAAWLLAGAAWWYSIAPYPIIPAAPEPTLTVAGETYTEAQYIARVAASIERYGFDALCKTHVQHLTQTALPIRGFDRDGYRALAFYAAACADWLEGGGE